MAGMIAIFLIAALGFHRPLQGMIFLAATISLRIYAGGYRADTYLRCFITTLLGFVAVMVLYEAVLLAEIYIWKTLSVAHLNQPLSERRIKECRMKGTGILVLEMGISCVLAGIQYRGRLIILLSILEVVAFMVIAKNKTYRECGNILYK